MKNTNTATRYEIAITDNFNRFENRIEIEEIIQAALENYGMEIGVDIDLVTMDVISVPR